MTHSLVDIPSICADVQVGGARVVAPTDQARFGLGTGRSRKTPALRLARRKSMHGPKGMQQLNALIAPRACIGQMPRESQPTLIAR